MLRIRFQRQGRRNAPFFRVVVAEHSRPVKGRFIEILGHFNPKTKECDLKNERILHWISVGAQPSDRVARLCTSKGISECEKFIAERVMKPSKVEERAKEAAEKAAQAKADAEAQAKAAAAEKAAEEVAVVPEAEEPEVTEAAAAKAPEVVAETTEAEASEVTEEVAEAAPEAEKNN